MRLRMEHRLGRRRQPRSSPLVAGEEALDDLGARGHVGGANRVESHDLFEAFLGDLHTDEGSSTGPWSPREQG
jgi:hypothetical protein